MLEAPLERSLSGSLGLVTSPPILGERVNCTCFSPLPQHWGRGRGRGLRPAGEGGSPLRILLISLHLLAFAGVAAAQSTGAAPSAPGICEQAAQAADQPSTDLYCIPLVPVPDVPTASGTVELGRVPSPFGVAVTLEGEHLYQFTLQLDGLPDPAALGPYTTYVAWATTPLLRPMVKLGEVRNGTNRLGRAGFNKFLVLVTAEATAEVEEREGRIVLRGTSPSMRMQPHELPFLLASAAGGTPAAEHSDGGHAHHAGEHAEGGAEWILPPMHPKVPMPHELMRLRPSVQPFVPGQHAAGPIPHAVPRRLVKMADGDTLELEAGLVLRTIHGRTHTMYGFNGQYPGPLIQVEEGATIIVNFHNRTEHSTAVHWHGIRLDNRFDGVPHVTQEPVPPGGSFRYVVHFPDAGIYWYHPHHREDIQQDLGLYGNLLVNSRAPGFFSPVNREEVLMLDDLLVGDEGLIPHGREAATHALMGRFGNLLLVNGEPDYRLAVRRGEVVRFFLTNVANTRTYNLSFGGLPIKVVGSDLGKFEREEWTENVVIAPAERYIVEVRFDQPGEVAMTNFVQALDHFYGNFFPEVDTLTRIQVAEQPAARDYSTEFRRLRENRDVQADIDRYRAHFDRPVDHTLILSLEVDELPFPLMPLMRMDSSYFNPVEWAGTMPEMDWVATGKEVRWILRDGETGRENMQIDWRFRQGELVKLRLSNRRDVLHAMQHPIHIHGQRFLVLAQNGVPNDNLVWKDTMLLPVGTTADILLELSNPGKWMLHCHIAEHLEAGMHMVFTVQ